MEQSRSGTAASAGEPAGEAGKPDASGERRTADPGTGPWSSVALWPRRRRLLVKVVALAALATVAVVVQLSRGPGPDDVVREFLTAIQERDVDKALAIAGVDRPAGEQARFLDARALSREWRIVALRTTFEHERDGAGSAQVRVTTSGPDGAEDGGFDLSKKRGDDRWRIDKPLLPLRLSGTSLWYGDVNGVIAPVFDGSYLMLPGYYRFYGTASDLMAIKPTSALLLPLWNAADGGTHRPASVTLTAKGEEAVRGATLAHLDECAKRAELQSNGCPFGVDSGDRILTFPDRDDVTDISNPRWQVRRHPVMAFSDRGDGFQITFVTPAIVRLTAIGRRVRGGGRPMQFTTYCHADRSGWYVAGLSAPGTLAIRWPDRAANSC